MTRYHRKGSVIVMVVGLLVLLAMVGSTFIIIAHMDRREARSIATSAPMKQVAGGVLQQIRAKLAEDLYINAGVIYGSATDYKQQADCPHEDYDKHLASFAPVLVGGVSTWKHISNHNGAAGFADIPANDALLVDTDGWAYIWDAGQNAWVLTPAGTSGFYAGDAMLFKSSVTNRSGDEYYVAVRVIDASSLINVNSAYGPPAAAASGTVMPVTNISLEALTNLAARDNVHDTRNGSTSDVIAIYNTKYVQRPLNPVVNTYLPFDVSDMLALAWGGPVPDTASGRLWEALGGQFGAAKPFLTAFSASRDYVRQTVGIPADLKLTHRVDMNAGFDDLFKAFYNAIPINVPGFSPGDPGRRVVAAQLAVNVIDYCDADDDVTFKDVYDDVSPPGKIGRVFGVERQPFITEAWLRLEWVGDLATGSVQQWSAIELFNPYKTAVSLAGYRLKVGANTNDLQNNPGSIAPGGRIVIVSSSTEIQAANKYEDNTLDLRQTCTLFRPVPSGGLVPVGRIDGLAEFVGLSEPLGPADPPVFTALRRDDAVARAKYSVAEYQPYAVTYLIGEAGCPAADQTNLGRSNVDPFGTGADDAVLAALAVAPTPVFVRNGRLINLGEVSRIFYVGPSSSGVPLDVALALAPTNVSNGRLYTLGAIKPGGWTVTNANIPDIPPICMLGDYMDALTPDTANADRIDTIYGRININTAPWQVIQYLPGISALTTGIGGGKMLRERVARDIVAYRDCLNNTAIGGHNYYYNFDNPADPANVPRSDAANAGLADLRQEAGFASPGEVAIPLAKIVTPNNYGASAPNCYKVADSGASDDGLDDITGDLSKYDIYYSWLSNQITVRSDVYIAYIRVQIGSDPTGAVRRYVAVIDRSNCTSTGDLPNVVMFAEMK